MKKLFTFFLALAASAGTMYANYVSNVHVGELYYLIDLDDKTAEVIGTDEEGKVYKYSGNIVIPSSITYENQTYNVDGIDGSAFYYCTGVTSVTIGNSVTSIGTYAFAGCSGLTSVTIPNGVTHIGMYAFKNCTGLNSITIGNSVTSIESWAFEGCSSLQTIIINSNTILTESGRLKNIFGQQVLEYIIGDDVTSIGNCAFQDCTGLTSVTIPNSVTSIGTYAFAGCSGLTSVIIGNGLINIGDGAFYNCSSLQTIIINSNTILTKSGSLKNIFGQQVLEYIIGDDVTSIGDYTFQDCTGLTSVTIPNSVTSVGYAAFYGCTGLTSPVYNAHVFAYMPTSYSGAYTIPDGIESIADCAFFGCTGLTYIDIPNSVKTIGEKAFGNCNGLTSVTIPNSVTSIGTYPFAYCTGLTAINVDNENLNYSSQEGALFNKDKTTLLICPEGKRGEFAIPNSVTSIGFAAFEECDFLTTVIIGEKVTNIDNYAFYDCDDLTSVICYATTPPALGEDVFLGTVTTSTLLYVPVGSISAYKYSEWDWFKNILPIGAEETETTTVKTEPTTNSVEVTWPVVAGAYTYELVIKDKSGNIVCTLIFNAQGQLISIAFNAPGRDGAPQQTQGAGFSFVVGSLDSGTEYSYDVIAKDENGNILDTKSGSFTTQAPQGIDDINAATKSQKIVRDGNVLILRGDKTYTIQGQEVK